MIICLNTSCSRKSECKLFGKKNQTPYQNYANYKEEFCKQFVKK